MNDILHVIKNRRSIRKYQKKEVGTEKLKNVLLAANWAPSSGNSQPWEFIVTSNEPVREVSKVFYDFAKGYVPTALYIPAEEKDAILEYAKDFGGAPNHIIVTYPKLEDSRKREEALKASCAAIQNLLLMAKAEGLGTVWIGGKINHSQRVREILNVLHDRVIAGIIPIGYPVIEPMVPPRKDPRLEDKVKWLGF